MGFCRPQTFRGKRLQMTRAFSGVMLMLVALVAWPADTDQPTVSEVECLPGLSSFVDARACWRSTADSGRPVKAYERAIREEPDSQRFEVNYAALLVKLGMPGGRSRFSGPMGTRLVRPPGESARVGPVLRSETQDSLADAEAAIRAALDGRSDDPSLQMALAQILHRLGKIEEAEAEIADLRAARGDSPQSDRRITRVCFVSSVGARTPPSCTPNVRRPSGDALGCRSEPGGCADRAWTSRGGGRDDAELARRRRSRPADARGHPAVRRRPVSEALRTVHRVLRQAPDSPRAKTLEALCCRVSAGMPRPPTSSGCWSIRTKKTSISFSRCRGRLANSGDSKAGPEMDRDEVGSSRQDSGSLDDGARRAGGARVELVGESHDLGEELAGSRRRCCREVAKSWYFSSWTPIGGMSSGARASRRCCGSNRASMVRLGSRARAYEAEFRLRLNDSRGHGKRCGPCSTRRISERRCSRCRSPEPRTMGGRRS